jgi:transcriptional regulator with XRE-family HTH domain
MMADEQKAEEGRPKPITGAIRKAVLEAGENVTQVARRAKVSQGGLSEFARGRRDLRGRQLDKLAAYLGLQVIPAPRPRGRPKGKTR